MIGTATCAHCGQKFQADTSGLAALVRGAKTDRPELVYRLLCPHCGKRTTLRIPADDHGRSPPAGR